MVVVGGILAIDNLCSPARLLARSSRNKEITTSTYSMNVNEQAGCCTLHDGEEHADKEEEGS